MSKGKEAVNVFLNPAHKEYYALGAVGASTLSDFRIHFYNKDVNVASPDGIVSPHREINSTIILPFKPMKELAIWLMRHTLDYEKEHGDIIVDDVSLRNLITVLENINKYDIEDLKSRLAKSEKGQKVKKTKKKVIKKKKL